MRRVKQGAFIIFFFGLLVCIAAAPTFVTHYYNGRLMGSVTLRELPPEEDVQAAAGIWDRLEIVKNARRDGTVYLDYFIDDETWRGEGRNTSLEVLRMLQDQLGWLMADMEIELGEIEELLNGEKMVYVDRERWDMPVGIWHVNAETPDYLVDAYMDEETGMLYDISLYSKYSVFSKQAPENFREAGRTYMGLEAERTEGGGWLDVGVDYNDGDMLRLYIYGSRDDGKAGFVKYTFGEDWTDGLYVVDVTDGTQAVW